MRPSLVAVLVLSLVGLSGAAMSDGMPAKQHHYAKVKKAKVVKKHHRHGPECPPEHDDSWAIAEQLNHEEWLRHRQDDLSRRGGGYEDDAFSSYDDRYERDYAARDDDRAWDRAADDADLLREAGAGGFRRDHSYQGSARRYVDKRVVKRYSARERGYGWDGGQGWDGGYGWSGGHGWASTGGHGKVERRVYGSYGGSSHGGDYAWGDYDRFGGGHGYGGGYGEDVYAGGSRDFDERSGRYRERDWDDEVYAGGPRDFDERSGRYEAPRHDRKVIVVKKRYPGGHMASRYGYADDYAAGYRGHGYGGGYGYAGGGYGQGGGYAASSYSSSSYGYGDGYGYGRGGGSRFHYDAGYAGRDELGYLTWPGKAG